MSHTQEYWDGFADGYELALGDLDGRSAEEPRQTPVPRRTRGELRGLLYHIGGHSAAELRDGLAEAARSGDLAAYRDHRRCAEIVAGRVA